MVRALPSGGFQVDASDFSEEESKAMSMSSIGRRNRVKSEMVVDDISDNNSNMSPDRRNESAAASVSNFSDNAGATA